MQVFHLNLNTAASTLGITTSRLKALSRSQGFKRWPQRKVMSLFNLRSSVEEDTSRTPKAKQVSSWSCISRLALAGSELANIICYRKCTLLVCTASGNGFHATPWSRTDRTVSSTDSNASKGSLCRSQAQWNSALIARNSFCPCFQYECTGAGLKVLQYLLTISGTASERESGFYTRCSLQQEPGSFSMRQQP